MWIYGRLCVCSIMTCILSLSASLWELFILYPFGFVCAVLGGVLIIAAFIRLGSVFNGRDRR